MAAKLIEAKALCYSMRSRSSLNTCSFTLMEYLATLKVLVPIFAGMTALWSKARENIVSFVPKLGVVRMDQRISGSSSSHAPLASLSLFFIAVKIIPLMVFVWPFVCGWAPSSVLCECEGLRKTPSYGHLLAGGHYS